MDLETACFFAAFLWLGSFSSAYLYSDSEGNRIRHMYNGSQLYLFSVLLAATFLFYVLGMLVGGAVLAGLFKDAAYRAGQGEVWETHEFRMIMFFSLFFAGPFLFSAWAGKRVVEYFVKNQPRSIMQLLGR